MNALTILRYFIVLLVITSAGHVSASELSDFGLTVGQKLIMFDDENQFGDQVPIEIYYAEAISDTLSTLGPQIILRQPSAVYSASISSFYVETPTGGFVVNQTVNISVSYQSSYKMEFNGRASIVGFALDRPAAVVLAENGFYYYARFEEMTAIENSPMLSVASNHCSSSF